MTDSNQIKPGKTKLLVLSWEYFPVFAGGLGVMMKNFAEELEKQNVETVTLIPNSHGIELPQNVISLHAKLKTYLKKAKEIPDF